MFSFRVIFIGGKCSFLQKWDMTTGCLRGWSTKYLYKAVEISEVKTCNKFNETFPREGLPGAACYSAVTMYCYSQVTPQNWKTP